MKRLPLQLRGLPTALARPDWAALEIDLCRVIGDPAIRVPRSLNPRPTFLWAEING